MGWPVRRASLQTPGAAAWCCCLSSLVQPPACTACPLGSGHHCCLSCNACPNQRVCLPSAHARATRAEMRSPAGHDAAAPSAQAAAAIPAQPPSSTAAVETATQAAAAAASAAASTSGPGRPAGQAPVTPFAQARVHRSIGAPGPAVPWSSCGAWFQVCPSSLLARERPRPSVSSCRASWSDTQTGLQVRPALPGP